VIKSDTGTVKVKAESSLSAREGGLLISSVWWESEAVRQANGARARHSEQWTWLTSCSSSVRS